MRRLNHKPGSNEETTGGFISLYGLKHCSTKRTVRIAYPRRLS